VCEKLNNSKYAALQKCLHSLYIKRKTFSEKEKRMYHRIIPREKMKHLPRGRVVAGGHQQFHYSNQPLQKAEGMGFFVQPLTLN
jgi:hypothetical protein